MQSQGVDRGLEWNRQSRGLFSGTLSSSDLVRALSKCSPQSGRRVEIGEQGGVELPHPIGGHLNLNYVNQKKKFGSQLYWPRFRCSIATHGHENF